jgi:DNA-binding transcriptional ArsR family regulator
MHEGPVISSIAALIGDPARANMLTALMDGRALTVSELAQSAGVSLATTSGHLTRLAGAGLVTGERQGRHRYFRLSGADVAQVLEALMGLAERTGARRVRTGPRDPALRLARVCYDHLAGEYAVALLDNLLARSLLAGGAHPQLTAEGRTFFQQRGLDLDQLSSPRRPLCRTCLDWSERRAHLAGALGAAVLEGFSRKAGRAERATGR